MTKLILERLPRVSMASDELYVLFHLPVNAPFRGLWDVSSALKRRHVQNTSTGNLHHCTPGAEIAKVRNQTKDPEVYL